MRAKLFVGNLNYQTTTETLETVFRTCHGYSHAKVRRCPENAGLAQRGFSGCASLVLADPLSRNPQRQRRTLEVCEAFT